MVYIQMEEKGTFDNGDPIVKIHRETFTRIEVTIAIQAIDDFFSGPFANQIEESYTTRMSEARALLMAAKEKAEAEELTQGGADERRRTSALTTSA